MMLKDGTHMLWIGPTDTRDRPILHSQGRPYQVARVAWVAHWGIPGVDLPQRRRLTRVCTVAECVKPEHWVLSHPLAVCKALGFKRRQVRAMTATLRSASLSGAGRGLLHDVSRISEEGWGMTTPILESMATSLGVSKLTILAVWSVLVLEVE